MGRFACLAAGLAICLACGCTKENAASRPEQARDGAASHEAASNHSALSTPSRFARFTATADDQGRFETAITTYRGPKGARVSLIATVHIADAAYYAGLNREFEGYDAVLYELVASDEARPEPGQTRSGGNLLSWFQKRLEEGLELEFQLEAIDYTAHNFVHADLTPGGFQQKMAERGESYFTIIWDLLRNQLRANAKMVAKGRAAPRKPVDLVTAFRSGHGRHTLRLMLARQLTDIEALAAPGGKGSILIEGRNERALEVLRRELGQGKQNLAIYYGAAHMPSFEKSLIEALGFKKIAQRWLTAWDVTRRPDRKRN